MGIQRRKLCGVWRNTAAPFIAQTCMGTFIYLYSKETSMKKSNEAFEKLKRDLKEGTVRCAYIFYGEESYLREYYLGALRKALVPAGFEEFNYHRLEGKDLTV